MIDFSLTAQQVDLQQQVTQFVREHVIPRENDARQDAHGPSDALRLEMVALARAEGLLSPHAIAVRYGAEPAAMAWWQALAGYRLGSIACLNVHLHRSGRRPDVVWERFASAIPAMFGRAAALLRDADALNEPEP